MRRLVTLFVMLATPVLLVLIRTGYKWGANW